MVAAVGAAAAVLTARADRAPAAVEAPRAAQGAPASQSAEPVAEPVAQPAQQSERSLEQPTAPAPSVEPAVDASASVAAPRADPPQAQPEPEPATQATQPESRSLPEPAPLDAPALLMQPPAVRQGEVVAAHVSAAGTASAVLSIDGVRSPMILIGETWFALHPFARDASVGQHTVVVELFDSEGKSRAVVRAAVQVNPSGIPLEEITIGDGVDDPIDQVGLAHDIDVRFHQHTAVTGAPLWAGPWSRPVEGEDSDRFGGMRSYNGGPALDWHHGHDIAADHGDPVVAPAPAVVAWAGELVVHGNGVILDHGAGVYSGYWHLSEIVVAPGQLLAEGEWLGNIGATGLSTGPHLHWEVIVRGRDVDALQWLGDQRPGLPTIAE